MDRDTHLKRLRFRAWHRGTKEADLLIGGFYDTYADGWSDTERDWFEALLVEDDVDVMAWAIGMEAPPAKFEGEQMTALKRLDYIAVAE